MIVTVNIDFLFYYPKRNQIFYLVLFYVIMISEVMNMSTSEIIVLVAVVLILCFLFCYLIKKGGFKDDNS